MFQVSQLIDEMSNSPAVQCNISIEASEEDIEAARAEIPESVRERLPSASYILFILDALKQVDIEDPGYCARFVLPTPTDHHTTVTGTVAPVED